MDLTAYYREGRWVALLELIDQLPPANRLNEATLNDPEAARLLAQQPKSREEWSPKVSEYNLMAVMGRDALVKLDSIYMAVSASGGGKPKPRKPFPAPRTELDKAREEADHKFSVDVVGMFGFSEEDL